MGWSIGYDDNWKRDIGYGVPSVCDHPDCTREIDRGLAYVCGAHPWGGDDGCGLFFCSAHLGLNTDERQPVCERCAEHAEPFDAKPDTVEWMAWKLNDESWADWRRENPAETARMQAAVEDDTQPGTDGPQSGPVVRPEQGSPQ